MKKSRIQTFFPTQDSPGLVLSHDPYARTVRVLVGVHMGSKNETLGHYGVAHLLEHLIFRGTFTYPSLFQMANQFNEFGTSPQATTNSDYTTFYTEVLPHGTLKILRLLLLMVKQPLLNQESLALEKKAVLNELQSKISEPSVYLLAFVLLPHLFRRIPQLVPYSHPSVGDKQDVIHASLLQVIEFYQEKYLDPSNLVICLHGNISTNFENLAQRVSKLWNSIPYREDKVIPFSLSGFGMDRYPDPNRDPNRDPQDPLADPLDQKRPALSQNYFTMGWISYPFESFESYVLEWISTYLTGTYISKLYLELRVKRGLVYTVHCEQLDYEKTGAFVVSWQLANPADILLSHQLILETIHALKTFNDPDVLSYWKKWLVQRYMLLQGNMLSVAEFYLRQMLFRRRVTPVEHLVQIIESISVQDVQKVAQKVFHRAPLQASLLPK